MNKKKVTANKSIMSFKKLSKSFYRVAMMRNTTWLSYHLIPFTPYVRPFTENEEGANKDMMACFIPPDHILLKYLEVKRNRQRRYYVQRQ